ncbi:MAG: alpha/beta hydrolase [Clostridia bacterium]|nr:alpha/beta hydrolase [Clostridia bacterium]
MIFHTFGNKGSKIIILIHGMLSPWQIWQPAADRFAKDYYVIVPELDAHTEDEASQFHSIENEAEQIKDYLQKHCGTKVFAVCGLSMGGRIAAVLAGDPEVAADCLVLDGAPLMPVPGVLKNIMKNSYLNIIRKSKKRDPKVIDSFKRNFLPEKHLENYLKIADNMEEQSVINIIDSVFSEFEFKKYDESCKILFMHGTKGNESVSKKAAIKLKSVNPQTEIRCYKGYAHARLACFEEEKWIDEVCGFINDKKIN